MATNASEPPLYLGLDLSTQQLKAIVVAPDLAVVAQAKVDFDADFANKYGVRKGVLVNEDEGEVYAPVQMWLEALDLVFARLHALENGPAVLARVRAISGSGQQHGSVYWAHGAEKQLAALQRPQETGTGAAHPALVDHLADAFARPWAPNWQDQSTQAECDEFDACLAWEDKTNNSNGSAHGRARLADVTGSAAHHRFTGPQILRIRRRYPAEYANTVRIALVSSFVASVLLGKFAPIDISDICGMDLWDIPRQQWSTPLLALAAGGKVRVGGGDDHGDSGDAATQDLRAKLGEVCLDGGRRLGAVAAYFAQRYGFSPECAVVPFTGDNPATLLALPLRPRDAIVSLGTSTTFLMVTPHYKPDPSYHFFHHPTTPGQYMFMLCYKNGGLAREKVRDALPAPPQGGQDGRSGKDGDPWAAFNRAVVDTPVLGITQGQDRAKLGLYFYLNEIVPNIPAGTWRYTCNAADGSDLQPVAGSTGHGGSTVTAAGADDDSWGGSVQDARSIVESQALSMRLRSQPLVQRVVGEDRDDGEDNKDAAVEGADATAPPQARRIYLVGGGSYNPAIAQVLGEVLGGAEGVYRLDVGGNACALGGAYKALWALERKNAETFDALIGRRWQADSAIEKADVGYRAVEFEQYGRVLGAFAQMEQEILQEEHAKTKRV
ncbi:d-xylulose kinase [Niveomyces insectorum RCEF 264]|uniref:Xylulose kinase n=1 Tax=Niveomyces insectorum RCEF 264 TaxID=1081102 RepID=A0A167Y1X9_9HYPO|nr:d-xylulose kinase [Niveomyces insectorum RCEF 264]